MERDEVAKLVRGAADGDERCWEALVERFGSLVWSVARGHGLSKADAADVSQTTWLRLAEHLAYLRDPERVGAWLVTTARRESLRLLRGTRRQVPVDPHGASLAGGATDGDLAEGVVVAERDVELWRAFEALSGVCKALLRALLADPPPSYAELASAFGMPVGSIGPTRARCLDRLRWRVGAGQVGGAEAPVLEERRKVS